MEEGKAAHYGETIYVNITPDVSILPKLGKSGYSVIEAISELLDNSIDARIDGKRLSIRVCLSAESFIIEDNGMGMDATALASAMKLGFSTKSGMLGEFGLGLKTAATSLGTQFRVQTTPVGEQRTHEIVFNEGQWLEDGTWDKFPVRSIPATTQEHGTRITITGLRTWYSNLVTIAKKEFGERYYPFLDDGFVEIFVNDKACTPAPPDVIWKNDIILETKSGHVIRGWAGKKRGTGRIAEQGFNLYKSGRLVRLHEAFGFKKHPTLRHLTGEVHLDHVPVTHNKREFITTNALFEEALACWTEAIVDTTNRIRKEARGNDGDNNDENTLRIRNKVGKRIAAVAAVTPYGSAAEINVRFAKVGLNHQPYTYEPTSSGLDITVNTASPVYAESSDKELFALLHIAEAVAMASTNNLKEAIELRNCLLRAFYDPVFVQSVQTAGKTLMDWAEASLPRR